MTWSYLDNLATTPIDPRVLTAMMPYLAGAPGNPHSVIHLYGLAAHEAVEGARAEIASALGVTTDEVVFMPSATAANNVVLQGVTARKPTSHVLVTAIEHSSVLETVRALSRNGVQVEIVPVSSSGVVDPDEIKRRLRPETVLVSVMAVNNEVGSIQPVKEIANLIHNSNTLLHCDAAQAPGKIPLDFVHLADYVVLSGHKMYGPKGTAALIIRKGALAPRPLLYGGGQEKGLWPGTVNVTGVVGLGKALLLAVQELEDDCRRIEKLADMLLKGILTLFPGSRRNGGQCVPHCLSVCFEGVVGETLLSALTRRGIAVSFGSACSTRAAEPSHVLTAMGLSEAEARRTIRFGLGRFTTEADITLALDVMKDYTPR